MSNEPYLLDIVIDPAEALSMVPPGERLTNIIQPIRAEPKIKKAEFDEIKKIREMATVKEF